MIVEFGTVAPTIGASGLCSLFVIAVLRGRLVPRKTMEDALKDRDDWKSAHTISETARLEMAGQVKELLEHARTSQALLEALPGRRHE